MLNMYIERMRGRVVPRCVKEIMVAICHHIHSMHTGKSEMWYVCIWVSVSTFFFLAIYLWIYSFFPLFIYYLSVSIYRWLMCVLLFFVDSYFPKTQASITLPLFTCFRRFFTRHLGFFQWSSSWAINLRPFASGDSYLWIRRKAWGPWWTKLPEVTTCQGKFFLFRKCLWCSTHLNFYLVYLHMDLYIYIYILHFDIVNMFWHFLTAVLENGMKDGFFQTLRNGHW